MSYSIPSHVGKLKKPVLHASHLSLVILALQLHTPLSSHASPFDPSASQWQAEIRKIELQILPPKHSKTSITKNL